MSRLDPDGTVISYTYDGADNRTSVTTPAGTTEYTYDAVNRLETVTDPNSGVTTYSYDPVGNPVTTLLPNGALESREYDSLNRLTFVQHTDATSAVIASYRYTLDSTGRRLAVEEQNRRRVEYDYDDFYRLVGEDVYDLGDVVPSRTTSYVYDVVGNRLSRDDSVEGLTEYEYDDNDRLTVQTRGTDVTEYAHDDSGNLIAERVNGVLTASYEWDSENRLVAADTDGDGAIDAEYEYDPNGNRVSQTVDGQQTRFLLDLNRPLPQVLVEYEPSGISTRVVRIRSRSDFSEPRRGNILLSHRRARKHTRADWDIRPAHGSIYVRCLRATAQPAWHDGEPLPLCWRAVRFDAGTVLLTRSDTTIHASADWLAETPLQDSLATRPRYTGICTPTPTLSTASTPREGSQ